MTRPDEEEADAGQSSGTDAGKSPSRGEPAPVSAPDASDEGPNLGGVDSGTAGSGGAHDGGSSGSDGSSDAGGDPGPARALEMVFSGGSFLGHPRSGLTVGPDGTIYVLDTDDGTVYAIADGVESTYLTPDELGALLEPPSPLEAIDLDIDADGTLYVLTDYSYSGLESAILRVSSEREVTLHRDLTPATASPKFLEIVDASLAVVLGLSPHLTLVDDSGFLEILTTHDDSKIGTNCNFQDLAVQRSGAFLYLSGCNGDPILRGDIHSETAAVLFEHEFPTPDGAQVIRSGVSNYTCITRDPSGGFFVMLSPNDAPLGAVLFHFDEDVDDEAGWTHVRTDPDFREVMDMAGRWSTCELAATPSGTLYIATNDEVWAVAP